MIDQSSIKFFFPPIPQYLIDNELTIQVAHKTLAVPYFSYQSQDVERMIKKIRRASVIVSDEKSRYGEIVRVGSID